MLETEDGATKTRVVNGACIFLNEPDFAGGAGCALHIAALEAGERYIDWKPDVCWQLPLRLEHHTDDNGYVTSTLREWKRRDWGEGGDEFHWWCTESDDAFVGGVPAYHYLPRRDRRDGRPGRRTTRWSPCSSARSGRRSPTPPSASADPSARAPIGCSGQPRYG